MTVGGEQLRIAHKDPCKVLLATNANLASAAPLVVDGVTVVAHDRVLVKGQTDQSENGIYVVVTPGSGSNGVWARARDFDTSLKVVPGSEMFVLEGVTFGLKKFRLDNTAAAVLNTTNLTFTEVFAGSPMDGPGLILEKFDHFLTLVTISNLTALYGDLLVSVTGAGASVQSASSDDQRRPGIAQMNFGTTATGRVSLSTFRDAIRLGAGPWRTRWGAKPTVLSVVAQEYAFIVGFIELTTGLPQSDGAYFLYDRIGTHAGAAASVNWQCVTAKSGGRTYTTTSVAVSIASWADLDIQVNSDATSVKFYIGGVLVATHTTSIPSASGETVCLGAVAFKSAGTTDVPIQLDYYGYRAILLP